MRLHLSKVSTDKPSRPFSLPPLSFQIPTENLPPSPFNPFLPFPYTVFRTIFSSLLPIADSSYLGFAVRNLSQWFFFSPREALDVHVIPVLKDERVVMVMRGVWFFVSFSRVEADVFLIGVHKSTVV